MKPVTKKQIAAEEAARPQKVELYPYQEKYLAGIGSKHIFAADTGTGKTYMALAQYDRQAYLKPLLILAPASKIVTGDWERELKAYFAGRLLPEYEIYSYEKFSRATSLKQYRETKSRGVWHDWLNKHTRDFAIIADEVHRAKNPQSGIGRAVFTVSQQASFFVGLSATPLPNAWQDAANYFKIFGLIKNKTEFWKRYVDEVKTHGGWPIIRGYWNEGELQKRWNSIAKPLSKEQALDLPPLTVVPVPLPAGPDYIRVQKDRLFGDKYIDNPSALMHALRQSITKPKIAWLDQFLEGVSDNVVIFYNYKSERDEILTMIKKSHRGRKVFRIDGEKHETPNKESWGTLQRTITIAQYQSGSTGIELTYAATTVYFSPTYSYSNYEQSIGRTNRNGQTKKLTLYLLCAPTTLERDVWEAIRNKTDFQEAQWLKEKRERGW